jgi:transcriptional regulator with XRE-family HTH domain
MRIDPFDETPTPSQPSGPSSLGAGFLILVTRELTGLSQRALAAKVGASQPNLASLETGNRLPTVRTLMRIAAATGFELVIGLRRPDRPKPDPATIHALEFDLLGALRHNPQDDLADFEVFREPSPLEGPGQAPADADIDADATPDTAPAPHPDPAS